MSLKSSISLAALGAFLALSCFHGQAAHQIPANLRDASSEAQTGFIVTEGQRSLREKLQAGQERFALRQELRADLVQGIRANAASRRDYHTNDAYPGLAKLRLRSETVWLPWALLVFLTVAWFAVQWCRTGRIRLLPPSRNQEPQAAPR